MKAKIIAIFVCMLMIATAAVTSMNNLQDCQCTNDRGWIYYHNGYNNNQFGLPGGGTFEAAIRFTADELATYVGCQLIAVRFYHYGNVTHLGNIKIYGPGTSEVPGAILETQAYTVTGSGWFVIYLSIPIFIDGNNDLWVSVEISHATGEHPIGVDAGPAVPTKGDWLYNGSDWTELRDISFDFNWCIEANIDCGQAPPKWIPFIPGAEPGSLSQIKLKSMDTTGVMIDSDITGMYYQNITLNNQTYQKLDIPNEGHTSEIGEPSLPVMRRYLEIPYDVNDSVSIFYSNSTELNGFTIMPVQTPEIDNGNVNQSEFRIDTATYSNDNYYPPDNASVDEPVMMRGHRIVCLTLAPVQFNPVEHKIRVYSKIEVKVQYSRPAQVTGIEKRLESKAFEQLLENIVLNYKSPDQYPARRESSPHLQSGADYLIITNDVFATQVQQLADWKQRKGYEVKITKKSDLPGSGTAVDIISYLQNAYDTWVPAPTYVLLVGDADSIPTNYRTINSDEGGYKTATDLYYTTLDGSDYFPDLFIGRISVDNIAEATTVIEKIINYEKYPPSDSSFYSHLTVSAYFQDGSPYPGIADDMEDRLFVFTSEQIRDYLVTQGYIIDRIYRAETTSSPTHYNATYDSGFYLPTELRRPTFLWNGNYLDINNAINAGRFIFNHRDHGNSRNPDPYSIEGWGGPQYTTSNIAGLTNGNKLPVVFSINCRTGWFDGETDPYTTRNYECLCEELLRKDGGGAVAVIGSTRISYSLINEDLNKGFYDAIWPGFIPPSTDAVYKLGQILTQGKCHMATLHSDGFYRKTAFEEFHLFGDPDMEIWTSKPQPLTVSYPPTIGSGGVQSFVVQVTDGTNPLPGASVFLQKGTEVHTSGVTDAHGNVIFSVTSSTGGNLDITVTKHNYIPYLGEILVTSNGATISASPNSGHPGFSFTLAGHNFVGTELVTISMGGTVTSVPASGGSFSTLITVPSLPEGPTNIIATGGSSSRTAVAVFNVLPAAPDPYLYCQGDSTTWGPTGWACWWDNPDVVLYDTSTGLFVPSNNLIIGHTYDIRATIHNHGTVDAPNTQVTFKWADWGIPSVWYPLGSVFINVPASGSSDAHTSWTPSVIAHCCIQVEINQPSDFNLNNNLGQENTDVHHASPVEFSFNVSNPTNTTALVNLEVTQLGTQGPVWATQIERPYPQVLAPGKTQTVKFHVTSPENATVGETQNFSITAKIGDEVIGGIQCRVVKLMDLTQPKPNYLYLNNKQLIKIPWTVIIGPITIKVDAKDAVSGIQRVDFYVDNKLRANDTEAPYEWTWTRAFFKHTVRVVAYSNCGISDSREIQVWKFF